MFTSFMFALSLFVFASRLLVSPSLFSHVRELCLLILCEFNIVTEVTDAGGRHLLVVQRLQQDPHQAL